MELKRERQKETKKWMEREKKRESEVREGTSEWIIKIIKKK